VNAQLIDATLAPHEVDAEQAFREEVRAFLSESLTSEMREAPRTVLLLDTRVQQAWHRVLAAKGWIVPGWPIEHGGTGWSVRRRHVFAEELGRAKAPALSPFLNMIGPVLYTFGNERQIARHLPPLRAGDTLWCQGYSEPGAGSDLASLQTRAVRDGDRYIVNGQKIWTTAAREADWIFCLVRTSTSGKPQAGISFLLIDLKSPGISIRPITSIDGQRHLNEVFFSDVSVPAENLIGEENRGWEYAKFLLQHERNGIAETGTLRVALGNLRKSAAQAPGESPERNLLESPSFAKSLSEVEVDLIALEALGEQVLLRQERSDARDSDASVMKLRQSEVQQRISELAIDALGPYVRADQTDAFEAGRPPLAGPASGPQAVASYLFGRAVTILGGTSEIQRGIIYKSLAAAAPSTVEDGEEYRMLRDAVRSFLADSYAPETRRRAIASDLGRRPEFWRALANDIGLSGIGFDESAGGSGGGALEVAIVMEAFGEALVVEPYVSTVVIAGSLVRRSKAPWAAQLAAGIVDGSAVVAIAFAEPHARFDPADVRVTARRHAAGYVLDGHKAVVYGAPWATHFLVTARTAGTQRARDGVSVFLVEATHPSLALEAYRTIDGGRAADVSFDGAVLPADALAYEEGSGLALVEQALDEATLAICAESVGIMRRMVRETTAYLGQRRQFGRPLADFQVLQHRLADMSVATEQAAAMARFGAANANGDSVARAAAASAAKAFVSRALRSVAQNAVQLHGGMGVTEELEIGQLFKRATVAEREFGSIDDHLRRYAELGYRGFA